MVRRTVRMEGTEWGRAWPIERNHFNLFSSRNPLEEKEGKDPLVIDHSKNSDRWKKSEMKRRKYQMGPNPEESGKMMKSEVVIELHFCTKQVMESLRTKTFHCFDDLVFHDLNQWFLRFAKIINSCSCRYHKKKHCKYSHMICAESAPCSSPFFLYFHSTIQQEWSSIDCFLFFLLSFAWPMVSTSASLFC